MSDTTDRDRAVSAPADDTPASWPDRMSRALAVAALLTLLYAVAFDQGLLSSGVPLLHEVFHDGRHLLGYPCH